MTALATYPGNKGGSFIVVDYKDIDHKIHRNFLIQTVIANDFSKLKNHLIENGFPYNLSKNEWDEVKILLKNIPKKRMQLVNTLGFHNGVFLECENNIIGKLKEGQRRPILDPRTRIKFPVLEENGTLEEWQESIAPAAIHSSRIMLTISATFSAAFLHLMNIESGGFHLYGGSSTGKTT